MSPESPGPRAQAPRRLWEREWLPPHPLPFSRLPRRLSSIYQVVPTVRHLSSKFAHEWDLSEVLIVLLPSPHVLLSLSLSLPLLKVIPPNRKLSEDPVMNVRKAEIITEFTQQDGRKKMTVKR